MTAKKKARTTVYQTHCSNCGESYDVVITRSLLGGRSPCCGARPTALARKAAKSPGLKAALAAAPKRIVMGEGLMRYSMSKGLTLEIDIKGTLIEWPDIPGDPRVRLVLEVIE